MANATPKVQLVRAQKTGCGNGRRAIWRIRTGAGEREVSTPRVFTTVSTSGNLWNKLMYFYPEWNGNLDLLLNMDEIYKSPSPIRNNIYRMGVHPYVPSYVSKVHKYVASRAQEGSPASSGYRYYFDRYMQQVCDPPPAFQGLIFVDSGGFSFSKQRRRHQSGGKLSAMRPRNESSADPTYRRVRAVMRMLSGLIKLEHCDRDLIAKLASAAQTALFQRQALMQADILLNLDRVVLPGTSPVAQQIAWLFNLDTCKTFLRLATTRTQCVSSLLFAAIHPLGPDYVGNFQEFLHCLHQEEQATGIRFDGLALGSLVPHRRKPSFDLIVSAFLTAVKHSPFEGRWLHALGVREEIPQLMDLGFDTFDSSDPLQRSLLRLAYRPNAPLLVPREELSQFDCTCRYCQRHSPSEFYERRPGVCEVGTALCLLHNYEVHYRPLITTPSGTDRYEQGFAVRGVENLLDSVPVIGGQRDAPHTNQFHPPWL